MAEFTYDLNTNIGKLRLFVNDNDETNPKHTDDELQVFLDMAANIYFAAADVLTADANEALKNGECRGYTLGDRQEDKKHLAKDLLAVAREMKKKGEDLQASDPDAFASEEVVMAPQVNDAGDIEINDYAELAE